VAWITINFRVTPEEYERFQKRRGNDPWRTLFLSLLEEVEEIEKGGAGIYKEKYDKTVELLKGYFSSFYIEGDPEKTLENFYNALKKSMEEYKGFSKKICEDCGGTFFVRDDVRAFVCPYCETLYGRISGY